MDIVIHSKLEDLELDRQSWNHLVHNNETNTVFQTYEWFHAWWEIFGDNYNLIFVVLKDGQEIVAFCPLMTEKADVIEKRLRFAADINSDYCDFVAVKEKEKAITCMLDFLFNSNLKFGSILLRNIPDVSSSNSLLKSYFDRRQIHYDFDHKTITPTLLIRGHHDDAKGIISKYSVKRHVNKMNKVGEVSFKNFEFNDDKQSKLVLTQFFQQHKERFSAKNGRSVFEDKRYEDFYFNLVKKFKETDWLLFSILEFNGKPISFHFGFDYFGKIIWYKPCFDIRFEHASPGTVLLVNLIKHAISHDKIEVDYTIGGERYKNRFSNQVKFNNTIQINRPLTYRLIHKIRKFFSSILKSVS